MTTTKQITGILVLVTTIGSLLLLAGPASASSKPSGMTKAEYRALMLRSQALNTKYQLGSFAPRTPVVTADSGFSWSAFGIGAAATLALVLLAGGTIVGGRHGWRTPRAPISS